MSNPSLSCPPRDVEGAIAEFGQVLQELHAAHAELSGRAARMELELEAKVAELEAVLAGLPTGVVVRDADGAVVRTNTAAQQLLGASAEALRGRRELPIDALVADGTPCTLAGDGGAVRQVALRRSPMILPGGRNVGTVEILDDRTELESMTLRVHQQSKMAALGTMAGGIAHEIRNPLNAVRGFASLLKGRSDSDTTAARWAGLIEEGVDECDAIVGAVLAFAAPERLTIERLDATELASSVLDIVRRELARTGRDGAYDLAFDVPAGLTFDGDRIKLRQALRNLVANAVDVQPDGGGVRLEATRHGDTIELRVHDSGPGIPPELIGCVADPFFTTRADGTGLGLALVHTVARLHDGSLAVHPTPGPLGGADLRLQLPINSTSPLTSATPRDAR